MNALTFTTTRKATGVTKMADKQLSFAEMMAQMAALQEQIKQQSENRVAELKAELEAIGKATGKTLVELLGILPVSAPANKQSKNRAPNGTIIFDANKKYMNPNEPKLQASNLLSGDGGKGPRAKWGNEILNNLKEARSDATMQDVADTTEKLHKWFGENQEKSAEEIKNHYFNVIIPEYFEEKAKAAEKTA